MIEGENLSHGLAGQIIHQAAQYGRPHVQRVYGDVTRLILWEDVAGFEMIQSGRAKNAADMRMVIDAMDLVQQGGIGRVILASSDRDFTHLGHYLCARGIEVIGMGEAKTHESFRKACNRFVDLDTVAKPRLNSDTPEMQIEALLKAGSLITALSVQMRRKHGFLIGQQDKKNWRGYLSAYPKLYDLDPKGTMARVRLKQAVFNK